MREMFDDTLDRSFKVCELKEEFADMDVFDMNQPQYAKSFKNACKRAGFPAPVLTSYVYGVGQSVNDRYKTRSHCLNLCYSSTSPT